MPPDLPADQLPGEPEALVELLPTPVAPRYGMQTTAEDALVALGESAVPALERALHLGLDSKGRLALRRDGTSRRFASVRALSRIPGDRTTDLLVRCVADPPDCFSMMEVALRSLESRSLSDSQLTSLLRSSNLPVASAGIRLAKEAGADTEAGTALRSLLDPDALKKQFVSEYGRPTANPQQLWSLRLEAARTARVDLTPEMKVRAAAHIQELRDVAAHGVEKGGELAWPSYTTNEEARIHGLIALLVEMGPTARDVTSSVRDGAKGDFASILDIALLRLGDRSRLTSVAAILTDSPRSALRVVAALTLRQQQDKSLIPAFWKAMSDNLSRPRGGCIGPDQAWFPVRGIVADGLIGLGEDAKEVRAAAK